MRSLRMVTNRSLLHLLFALYNLLMIFFLISRIAESVSIPLTVPEASDAADIEPFQHELGYFNIVFIKGSKVGGSTVGGVVRRISAHYDLSGTYSTTPFIQSEPGIWAHHSEMKRLQNSINKLTKPVFLMTWIRDPVERAMSEFYHFHVSRRGESTDAAHKIRFLGLQRPNTQMEVIEINGWVQDASVLLRTYDFVGVTERFEESMLLMATQLNLTLCDILYLKAKDSHSGGVDDNNKPFVPHQNLENEEEEVIKFIKHTFHKRNIQDFEIFNAARKKLDNIIDKIGRSAFRQVLNLYNDKLSYAAQHCSTEVSSTNCYWNDNGCGYPCLDQMCLDMPDLNTSVTSLLLSRKNEA